MKLFYGFIMVAILSLTYISSIAVTQELNLSQETRSTINTTENIVVDYKAIEEERASYKRVLFHKKEIECLAKNIYFEARGESRKGKEAVGLVTINRVFSSRFPETVCDVVFQSKRDENGNPRKNLCQFSWYCDNLPIDIKDKRVYNKIYRVAEFVYINYFINTNAMEDFTNGSTHYHAYHVNPFWSESDQYSYTMNIGSHLFYRPNYE